MKLSEEKILLSEPVSNYVKKLKSSNKKNSTFNDLLMHISDGDHTLIISSI